MSKYARVAGDMAINILSSALPVATLQLIVLPLIAERMTDSDYGLALSMIALLSLCPATIGNVLDNIRLLHFDQHQRDAGVFSLLVLIGSLTGALICFAVALVYSKGNLVTSLLLALLAALTTYREYLTVAYRLNLNFRGIFINNLCLCAGYLLGYAFLFKMGHWELVYLSGIILSLLYICKTSGLWRERPAPNPSLASTSKDFFLLLSATLLGRTTSYADRLLLFPLLGGTEVSIYYVSTLFGKILSMAITPINSVVLSYITRLKKVPEKVFFYSLMIGIILSLLGYAATMALAPSFLSLIYPQYVDQALPYIGIMTISAYLHVLVTITNPYILKFYNLKWQVFINGLFSLFYCVLGIVLLGVYGLIGFCVASALAEFSKLIMQILIYRFGSTDHAEEQSSD